MRVELSIRQLSAGTIAEVVGGRIEIYNGGNPDKLQHAVCIDSDEGGEGVIFCGIKGARFDGSDFISKALESGSDCFICSHVPSDAVDSGKPFCAVVVEKVTKALGKLGTWYRGFSKAKFVAVTGSVGKTTTKEFIAAVCSAQFKTYKTHGNLNSDIGLPLVLLGLEPEDEVAVIEMGMSAKGEIEYLTQLVHPDIAVITNIGSSHIANLGSRENICAAKLEIRLGLGDDGILLINADEPLLFEKIDTLERKPKTMSIHNREGDFRAVNIRYTSEGIVYDLIAGNRAVTNVEVPALGKHNVYNSLTAFAVGSMLGMSDDSIRSGLKSFVGADMRQQLYDLNGITVIDDCYNASPESMRAAIDVLVSVAKQKNTQPCALLGDMLELGDYSRLFHDQLGQYAAQSGIARLFCYGERAEIVAEAAIKKGIRAENVYVVKDTTNAQQMADYIVNTLSEGDVLLVKASRAVRAEKVIECMKKRRAKYRPAKK